MSSRPDDENEEVYFNGENEDKTPMTCATQTLDLLALHLPPDKLVPYLVRKLVLIFIKFHSFVLIL